METDHRTVAYIDDTECVHVIDPMRTDPDTEEELDREWMQISAEQRLKVRALRVNAR